MMMSVVLAIGYGMVKIPIFIGRAAATLLMGLSAVIANMLLALPAMPTAARRANTALNGEFSIWNLGTFLGFLAAAAELFLVPMLAGMEATGDQAGRVDLTKIVPNITQRIPFASYILIGFGVTNFLSLCYELGRKRVTKTDEAKSGKSEERYDDGVSDFVTMYDSIRGFETLSMAQASELYARIIELLGEKKITPSEAEKLQGMVQNGLRNTVT